MADRKAPEPMLMRTAEVEAALGLSRPTIAKMVRAGEFPQPVRLGSRTLAWRVAEIRAWLDGLPRGLYDQPSGGLAQQRGAG